MLNGVSYTVPSSGYARKLDGLDDAVYLAVVFHEGIDTEGVNAWCALLETLWMMGLT